MRQPSTEYTFDSFGCCIYCRSALNLSREHIIPFALGGRYIITDGSCKECCKETHAFEGHVAGQMFGDLRGNRGPSRKKNRRPKTKRVIVEFQDMKTEMDVPYGEEPPTPIMVPLLPPAGILFDAEPRPPANLQYKQIVPNVADLDARLKKIALGKPAKITVQHKFQVGSSAFLRLLAKIAHGFCVVDCGIDAFEHLLPKYILGKDTRLHFVVGGTTAALRSSTRSGHTVSSHIGHLPNGQRYVIARIQLFKELGFPTYEVIAGAPSPELTRELSTRGESQLMP